MSFEFHSDKTTYQRWQRENAEKYVIPFIEEVLPLREGMQVLEVGCAEGGVLQAFVARGCHGVGVELSEYRTEKAREFLKEEIAAGRCELHSRDIYEVDVAAGFKGRFDLILLKDVIEHIPDQARFMAHIRSFLKPGGHIYFGFPPWHMPFGGHQQIARGRMMSKLPWYHLLPRPLYKGLLRMTGESAATVAELLDVKSTGISIERFERIARQNGYTIRQRRLYLINPIYEYKFKLRPRTLWKLPAAVPGLRNFYATCAYYLIQSTAS